MVHVHDDAPRSIAGSGSPAETPTWRSSAR
jgi:hypothetical protein